MTIRYLGHSSFLLCASDGTRIVTDPFGDVGIPMPFVRADYVTVSHKHYDHCNVSAVEGSRVLDRAGEYTVGAFRITAAERDHDDVHGAKRGKTLVFRFEADGVTVCHLGDIGEPCSRVPKELIACDVLLIPVGGNYTIGAREAKKYVLAAAPSVAIPMHYRVDGLTVDIDDEREFLSLFPAYEEAGRELELSREALPPHLMKIILMRR